MDRCRCAAQASGGCLGRTTGYRGSTMSKRFSGALLSAALAAGLSIPLAAHAQDVDSVVKKLKSTHTLTIGYRETSVPLSYLDEDKKPTGYAVEFCQKIAEAAKRDLNLPEIKIN